MSDRPEGYTPVVSDCTRVIATLRAAVREGFNDSEHLVVCREIAQKDEQRVVDVLTGLAGIAHAAIGAFAQVAHRDVDELLDGLLADLIDQANAEDLR